MSMKRGVSGHIYHICYLLYEINCYSFQKIPVVIVLKITYLHTFTISVGALLMFYSLR